MGTGVHTQNPNIPFRHVVNGLISGLCETPISHICTFSNLCMRRLVIQSS